MNHDPAPGVSELLRGWAAGDDAARDRLVSLVYAELRRRAAAYLRRERHAGSLQPTALVHEAFIRLFEQDRAAWINRAQFFGVASQMMRRILVDRARARRTTKRSGQWTRVTFSESVARQEATDLDVLDLDAALTDLAAFDPRKAQVAELRFFGGFTLQEAAAALGISMATAERDWQAARAWLLARLRDQRTGHPPR